MTKRTENAIDIWIKAIHSGTLVKGTCTACAVGNLVARGMGGEVFYDEEGFLSCTVDNIHWKELFYTAPLSKQKIHKDYLDNELVISNIKATDFNWEELALIEKTFENNTNIPYTRYYEKTSSEILDDQIKGLEAVIKGLLKFDKDDKTNIKEVFTNKVLVTV